MERGMSGVGRRLCWVKYLEVRRGGSGGGGVRAKVVGLIQLFGGGCWRVRNTVKVFPGRRYTMTAGLTRLRNAGAVVVGAERGYRRVSDGARRRLDLDGRDGRDGRNGHKAQDREESFASEGGSEYLLFPQLGDGSLQQTRPAQNNDCCRQVNSHARGPYQDLSHPGESRRLGQSPWR